MPLVSLGLVGLGFLRGGTQKLLAGLTASTCFLASFFINVIGAAHGAMLCDFPHSAVVKYLSEMLGGQMHSYPLAAALALPLAACVIFFGFMVRRVFTTSPTGQQLPPFP